MSDYVEFTTADGAAQALLQVFGLPAGSSVRETWAALAASVDADHSWDRLWLVRAALTGELPLEADVVRLRRDIVLNGAEAAFRHLPRPLPAFTPFGPSVRVRIVKNPLFVDVRDTAEKERFSGIQRVVRETVNRWMSAHAEAELVSWTDDLTCLRPLMKAEAARILDSRAFIPVDEDKAVAHDDTGVRLIPWGGRHLVPELATDNDRAERLASMGRFSSTRPSFIGYDTVPVTSSETAIPAMAAQFPIYLEAVAQSDRVVAISESAAEEFRGWAKMLPGSGRTGPTIVSAFLASSSEIEGELPDVHAELELDDRPIVLVVGTHEPRKNHLSVLHAARLLWQSGVRFQLVMLGSDSWESAAFDGAAEALQAADHPLYVKRAVDDRLLAACYRAAAVTVFTSTNEGFGLPIVESLQAGTPVIASNVGSMREIGERYAGVIPVDPRSDRALIEALRSALTDPEVLKTQREALSSNRYVTWDEYAADTWSLLVG